MSSFLVSLGGWCVLPDLLTNRLLSFQPYKNAIFRVSHPQNHHRYTFGIIILSYLLYTLVTSINNIEPNFYQVLGVTPGVDETGLRTAFRRMSLVFHPDRMKDANGGGEMFMHMRNMYEALKDPAKRFAYDRFGPDVLECTTCSTPRDYISYGFKQSIGFHVISFVTLVFFSTVGARSPVSFWRYLLFALGLMCELSVILAPFPFSQPSLDTLSIQGVTSTFWSSPESLKTLITPQLTRPPLSALPLTVLAFLFPSRVPYQHVKFIHQLSVFLSMALTRVAPVMMPPPLTDEYVAMERGKLLMSLIQAMEQETRGVINHTLRMIQKPQATGDGLDAETLSLLKSSMEDVLVEDTLARDVPDAWREARERAENGVSASTVSERYTRGIRHTLQTTPGGLPSPRPSPPPAGTMHAQSVRARSISLSAAFKA